MPGCLGRGEFHLAGRLHKHECSTKCLYLSPPFVSIRVQGLNDRHAEHLRQVVLPEIARVLAGQTEVEQRPQAVDVRPLVGKAGVGLLFGSAISERQHTLAGKCQRFRLCLSHASKTKVHNLGFAGDIDENIGRFQITVDNRARMSILDGTAELDHQVKCSIQRHRALAVNTVSQGVGRGGRILTRRRLRTGNVLHHDERPFTVLTQRVDVNNMDVVERCDGARLLEEALLHGRV